MANSPSVEESVLSVRKKLPNDILLRKFTILTEGNDNDRLEATKFILEHLSTSQSPEINPRKQGLADDVKYTVQRLIQGLSSGRKYARLGFSTALCEVLRTINDVDSKVVLQCMEEKAKPLLSGRPPKSVVGNVMLGKVICLLTLIQSKRLFQDGNGQIGQVVRQFLTLFSERTYLQQLCMNGIAQIIAGVSNDVFKKAILPHITSQISGGWGECSPDTLLLVLHARKHHQPVLKEILKEHWLDERLISEKNYPLIADVLLKSSHSHPIIHSMVDELLSCVHEHHLDVVKFWKTVCHPLLVAKGNTVPKKVLALYMFEKLLPLMNTPKTIKEILHPDIVGILVTYSPKKSDDVAKRVIITIKALVNHVSSCTDSKLQISVLRCLMKAPGSCLFDKLTGTDLIADVISKLQADAKVLFIKELMKAFIQQPSWIIPADSTRTLESLQWCTRELTSFVTCDHTEASWQLDILKFVFLHSFFQVKKENKDIAHCVKPEQEVPENIRKHVVENFFKTLSRVLTMNVKGQSRMVQFNKHIDLLYNLVTYVQQLLAATHCVKLIDSTDNEEIHEEWNKLVEVTASLNKKRASEEKITECHAFELLFIYTGLQLFVEPESTLESLQDLYVCYKKSSKRRKSMAADDGPAWIEVITELLLSMMFKDATLSRNVAKVVMTALADHVTQSALQLIIDAIEQTSLDGEEGMVGFEEEEDDDNLGDDLEAAKNDLDTSQNDLDETTLDPDEPASSSSDDDSDDSSDDDDDDEENEDKSSDEDSGIEEEVDIAVTTEMKAKVKAALGTAAASEDSDDSSEEEDVKFTDSQMFKLDAVLSVAFRGMQKGKKMDKNKAKQLVTFKIRVLDLVEALVKHHPTPTLIKSLMQPLIDRVETGKRKKVEATLGNKAHNTLTMLCKVKKMEPDFDVDKNELLELLQKLMKYTSKVSAHSMVTDVSKACLQVIRILTETSPISPLKTRSKPEKKQKGTSNYGDSVVAMVKAAMLDMFHHKPGHCPPAMFHVFINRFTMMFWPLTEVLIDTVGSPDIKVYQKTQAASILVSMVNKQVMTQVGAERWKSFVESLTAAISKVLGGMDADNVKKMYVQELLAVCHKIQIASPDHKVLGDAESCKLESMRSQLNQESKSYLNKLLPKQQSSNKRKKEKKQKKDSVDGASPGKKAKLDNQSDDAADDNIVKVANGNLGLAQDTTGHSEMEGVQNTSTNNTPKKNKKKKKRKSSAGGLDESRNLENSSMDSSIASKAASKSPGNVNSGRQLDKSLLNEAEDMDVSVSENLDNSLVGNDGNLNQSKSSKKKKKRKRKSSVSEGGSGNSEMSGSKSPGSKTPGSKVVTGTKSPGNSEISGLKTPNSKAKDLPSSPVNALFTATPIGTPIGNNSNKHGSPSGVNTSISGGAGKTPKSAKKLRKEKRASMGGSTPSNQGNGVGFGEDKNVEVATQNVRELTIEGNSANSSKKARKSLGVGPIGNKSPSNKFSPKYTRSKAKKNQ